MSTIHITRKNPHSGRQLPFARSELRTVLAAMAEAADAEDACVELALLDDADMETLNRQAMHCQGPTNILSFPAGMALPGADDVPSSALTGRSALSAIAPPAVFPALCSGLHAGASDDAPFLGWLALSPDTLLRECFLYGQEPEEHCIRLLAHGMAHLMGYDHGPDMDALTHVLEDAAADACACSL